MSEYANIRKSGLIAISLREDDGLVGVAVNGGDDDMIITTRQGQCIRFAESDVRAVGRVSQGVRGITLSEGDEVISLNIVSSDDCQMFLVTEQGFGKRVSASEYRVQSRGGKGVTTGELNDKTGLLAGAVLVSDDDDIMLIRDDGTIIRMHASDVNIYKRAARGVSVMKIGEGTSIIGVAKAEKEPEDADGADIAGEADAAEVTDAEQTGPEDADADSEAEPEQTEV
jgi:DNA gyrase subunit A